MRLSTVSTIFWVALAIFWSLFVIDLVTPGKEPALLSFVGHISVYVFLAAQFYTLGAKRSTKKTNTYEMSN